MTTTLTARGPEDLLAAVPVVLGFHPRDSLVMLTFGVPRTFHGRADLPDPADDAVLADLVGMLLSPCRAHGVERVAFIVYSADSSAAARLASALVPAFVADGIDVVDVLRAHEGRWCRVPLRAGGSETPMLPYDDVHHPFCAQAVFEGHVTHADREAVRATLAPDPDLRSRWEHVMAGLPPAPADVDRACEVVAGWVASQSGPDDEGAAQVLQTVTRIEVRDAALYAVTPDRVHDHLRVWSALLRGASDAQVPDVAAVTAFCAWQAGHGALAWCALDRCFEVDEDHRLAACLAECLVRAVPPTMWHDVPDHPGSQAG